MMLLIKYQLVLIISALAFRRVNTHLHFITVKENAAITGLQPFHEQKVTNKLHCYFACQSRINKCGYVQVRKHGSSGWQCSLYEFVDNILYYLQDSPDTIVSTFPETKHECLDWYNDGFKKDGVYPIRVRGERRIYVFCDMTTDGGGWTVFQKRFNGEVSFNRNWIEYAQGFGDINGEYWLGNELISEATKETHTEARFQATSFGGETQAVKIGNFLVAGEQDKYKVTIKDCVGEFCIDWNEMDGVQFTTHDMDNDPYEHGNCGEIYKTGWWSTSCYSVNFNGQYSIQEAITQAFNGIVWVTWKQMFKSLKETRMMLRSKSRKSA